MEKQKISGGSLPPVCTSLTLVLLLLLSVLLTPARSSGPADILSRKPRKLQSRELLENPSSVPLLLSLPLPPNQGPGSQTTPSLGSQLRDLIRRARQIKFKSSYRELPLVLQRAEERNRGTSKQLSEPVHVGPSEPPSGESQALKALPPSSEVYFQPEINDQTSRGKALKPFGVRKSNKNIKKFRKKMVGRKLIQGAKPKPQRVEHDVINFETSSTENVENTIRNTAQVFRGKSLQSSRISSPTRQNHSGGPNPDDSLKNPYYIETASNEISSYSFVPENSRVKPNSKASDTFQQQSATPRPSRLSNTKSASAQHQNINLTQAKTVGKQRNRPKSSKSQRGKMRPVAQKQNSKSRGSKNRGKSVSSGTSNVWDHFLAQGVTGQRATVFSSMSNGNPRTKGNSCDDANCGRSTIMDYGYSSAQNSLSNSEKKSFPNSAKSSSLKRGKSLSDNSIRVPPPKTSGNKDNYPNLVSVPRTDFHCGNYRSGEYFADVDTNCQVFHVCFGGRQASFVCPVGTAFSQQLLVCDWWHKVQCGDNRSKRDLLTYVPFKEARPFNKPFTRVI
ncbi:Chitin binding domain [Trinorchestia longiramus]|nr:Chitin binding domain [Trinorchestia longiramus]